MVFGLTKEKKRPILVWVIFMFFLVTVISTLFSFYLIYTGKVSLSEISGVNLKSLTVVDIGLSTFVGLTNLTGAVLLFFLRKQALYCFITSLVVNLSAFIWQLTSKGIMVVKSISLNSLIGMVAAWAILIAVCFYAWQLKKNGTLE